ncbi:MAG TPA: hypothetical protein VGD98_21125 [Ktedonobacteraceae bacterium]
MGLLTHDKTHLLNKDAKKSSSREVGAVILGGCFQGLGIARSLGRQGIPVCILDDEFAISRYSRYTTYSAHVKNLKNERQIIKALFEARERWDLANWVIYPTRDELVAALSHFRDELSTDFRVPTPSWEVIRWTSDKRNTYQLADSIGIPTPRTWYVNDVRELGTLEDKLPLVIKPAIKEHFIYATRVKAWRANTKSELRERFLLAYDILGPDEIMLQELIAGGGDQQFSYCAFFKEGQALGHMTCLRRRQHPLEFGRASTFVETIELPVLEELSNRFLKAIDYYGLIEMEYKYDQYDATYKLLDVNARTWGYHSLGARAGVDFSAMLFADQLGQTVEPRRARPGVQWVRLITDLPTGMQELARQRLSAPEYWRTLHHFDVEAVFDRNDPLPGLMELFVSPYLYFKRGF